MPESLSQTSAAVAMRRLADSKRQDGWKRNSFWLSPDALDLLDRVRNRRALHSREAALNEILEHILQDMFLNQEFLAVTK